MYPSFYLLFIKVNKLSISTLPSHIYSTILSFTKVTCNTHKNKKLLSIPLKLVPSFAKLPLPYFPPSTGRSASSHPKLVLPFFWRRAGRLLCSVLSLLSFIAELFMVSRLPVFFMGSGEFTDNNSLTTIHRQQFTDNSSSTTIHWHAKFIERTIHRLCESTIHRQQKIRFGSKTSSY